MQIDHETLMAFADGALEPDDAARVAAAVAADPALQAQLERHRALRAQLASAFDDVLDEPVPARLQAAARGRSVDAGVSDIEVAATRRAARAPRRWAWPEWGAMAASLLLGIVVAQWLPDRDGVRDSMLAAGADGRLHAHAHLAAALDTQLASAPVAGPVAVGVSFRAADGGFCRSFVVRRGRALAGLACRDRDGWQVPVVVEATAAASGELRQASTPLPAAVLAEMDARIQGEPLDAASERAARDAGWR